MLNLRADKLARVLCSLGFALLLPLQQKVCPWLVVAPGAPGSADVRAEQQKSSGSKKTKRLPHILPDTAVPRWTSGSAQAALRLSVGARDGVVSCGSREPAGGGPTSASLPGGSDWHSLSGHADLVQPVSMGQVDCGPRDPAIHVILLRTGPPAGGCVRGWTA